MSAKISAHNWPELSYTDWKDTLQTVQLWTQIVGKVRLKNMPWINHSWHVTLYISARELTTGSIPYQNDVFEIEFDFINHVLVITSSTGAKEQMQLQSQSVASFHKGFFEALHNAGIETSIVAAPNEVDPAIPFAKDELHCTYDGAAMHRYWQALVPVHNVFTTFRAGFGGKCSPVHFFWGAFDLAVTRFSGRDAPKHPGGAPNMPDVVMQEAYSHEVSSVGFWPGGDAFPQAAFYSYCYPTNEAFGQQTVQPAAAFYSAEMGEFFLPYEAVRTSSDPAATLLQFCQSTYEAAAITGKWTRQTLECDLTAFEK